MAAFRWFRKRAQKAPAPRHIGELWDVLQQIAREEDPEVFATKMVAQHAAESLEGKKDVDRWLQAYLRRVNPDHAFRFPAHHPRHRGFCLQPRHWPDGTLWEAFSDETLLRAPVAACPSREELTAALDEWLDRDREGR